MKNQEEMLDQAIKSMREAEPEAGEISASAAKVAGRLGIAFADNATIQSCDDIQPLFAAYRAGTLAENRSLYVVQRADGAGHSVATIFVGDLDPHVAAIAARGLEPDERETYPNGVRKVVYRDPDGNEVGFGGPPLDDRSSA